jgi:hypothetical protein
MCVCVLGGPSLPDFAAPRPLAPSLCANAQESGGKEQPAAHDCRPYLTAHSCACAAYFSAPTNRSCEGRST